MKDTLKQLLTDCLSASKKGGPGGGVDPSKFPSQVCYQCSFFDCRLSNVFLQNLAGKSVSGFSTPPFHVSGFTLLLLYVLLHKFLSKTPMSFIEITTQGR